MIHTWAMAHKSKCQYKIVVQHIPGPRLRIKVKIWNLYGWNVWLTSIVGYVNHESKEWDGEEAEVEKEEEFYTSYLALIRVLP